MEITKIQQDGNTVLKVEGALSIYEAGELKKGLSANIADDVTLDLSNVETCDTAAVQILVSACKSAARAGKSFASVSYSAGVENAFEQVGLNCKNIFNCNKET